MVVCDEDPDEGRSRLVGVEHELALLRCAFEYHETLDLKAPWNNREPKGAFVLHILVYEKRSQRELLGKHGELYSLTFREHNRESGNRLPLKGLLGNIQEIRHDLPEYGVC